MSYWMPSDSQWVEDLFPLMSYWMPTAKIGMLTTKKKFWTVTIFAWILEMDV